MSEEKNLKIKNTLRNTKERHSHMDCRIISAKIQENRLSKAKLEKLYRCFPEAKLTLIMKRFSALANMYLSMI